jgi:hypothetical protein
MGNAYRVGVDPWLNSGAHVGVEPGQQRSLLAVTLCGAVSHVKAIRVPGWLSRR